MARGIAGSAIKHPQAGLGSPHNAINFRTRRSLNRGANSIAAWIALIGLVIPAAEVQIYVANAKLTAGRIGIFLLFFPALIKLFQRGRRALLCDYFAWATAGWMFTAGLYTGGPGALGSVGAESIEFLGAYVVARAFVFGPAALNKFIWVLKVLAVFSIILGIADHLAERPIVHDTLASIFQVQPPPASFRTIMGMTAVRAMSTFDHSILFGAFCSLVGAITLYSEPNLIKRILMVGFCLLGAILALSSAPLMAVLIALGVYTYDQLLRLYSWRWKLLWTMNAALLLLVFIVTNNPLGWLISHFTLEPASGYFRFLEWDLAVTEIAKSPITGYAFNNFGNLLDVSVDTIWLVLALRFGLPAVAFLILANAAACLPTRHTSDYRAGALYINQMCTAFSLALFLFMFMGLTVHYWNYMWIFWGLCLGVRVSLREETIGFASRSRSVNKPI